ncbi:alcohol oxidase [Amylostereum chailletii]|nr:alcohol oxidase [Amylostereum chailletii]
MRRSSRIRSIFAFALALGSLHSHASDDTGTPRPRGVITDPALFAAQPFDYIVLGGGTAGLVVAARLSEDPTVTVGVVQAGTYRPDDDVINLPTEYTSAVGNATYDWNFSTTPQLALDGRILAAPRGRVLGGSSAINAPLWQRASARDYDNWGAPFGNDRAGWSFAGLLPYFEKTENWTRPPLVLPGQTLPHALVQAHGTRGPLEISYNNFYPEPVVPGIAAINALGIPTNSDPDLGMGTNATLGARTVSAASGLRSYAASAYFAPNARRPNLLILTEAVASKVDLESEGALVRATGVRYIVNGTTYGARAAREVVLSAGSFQSPQLLELSGIGNASRLESVGIEAVVDLPGVGENLQDHTLTASDFIVKPGVLTLDALSFNATFSAEQTALFAHNRTGALTYSSPAWSTLPLASFLSPSNLSSLLSSASASTFSSSTNATTLRDVQYRLLAREINDTSVGWGEFTLIPSGGLASPARPNVSYISPIFLNFHPFSRGSVHINTTDPAAPPLIDPNYFGHPLDLAVAAYGAQFVRRWAGTAPLADLVDALNAPNATVESFEEFERFAVSNVQPGLHYFGTAAMAARELGGVVDDALKVWGTANLRVVDASVLPATVGAAMQATVYAVAEKGADMIKASW